VESTRLPGADLLKCFGKKSCIGGDTLGFVDWFVVAEEKCEIQGFKKTLHKEVKEKSDLHKFKGKRYMLEFRKPTRIPGKTMLDDFHSNVIFCCNGYRQVQLV
jgi:hypothetical protein